MSVPTRIGLVTATILGALSSVGTAAPLLTVSFTTTPVGAIYAPQNCVAVWAEKPGAAVGTTVFVKTIGRWCNIRKEHLVAWKNKAGLLDADAVTGATRLDHGTPLSITWDLKDKLGVLLPDGIYTIRMETTDGNATTTGENWQATFTFTKGLVPDVTTPIDPHYTNVTINFNPTAGECNNNVVDPGETCDPPGSCPVDCAPSGSACAPNVIMGSSATCSATCAVQAITSCINDDGCCVDGCSPLQDNDCGDKDIAGGCETGSSSSGLAPLAFGMLGALFLFGRKRRTRS